ncbi:MAG: aspartyl protease family protein [Gammaproteobacteria bacterium]|nr:aspartyl protease family protein [Gammaproteobacteria bacterium]
MKRTMTILMLVITACSPTISVEENTMNSHIDKAEQLFKQGHFPEAQAEYLKALQQDPNNNQLLHKLGLLALWENDTKQAIDYLLSSYENSNWLGRRWPLRSQLTYQIGSAYQRRDDYASAAKWYARAVGPWAIGPLKMIQGLQRHAEAFAGTTPYQITGDNISELPFVMLDPLPVVEVSINGQGPYEFFIDTGGADVILRGELAQEFGLPRHGEITGTFAGGKEGKIILSKLEQLGLGGIDIHNLPVHLHKLEGVDEIFQRKIHGVIGTSLLRHFYASIDYRRQKLVLRQKNSGNRKLLDEMASDAINIPFWLIETHMIMARGRINDLPETLLFVDTGLADRGFLISQTTADAAGLSFDWSGARESSGGGGKIRELYFTLDQVTLGTGVNTITQQAVKASIHEGEHPIFKGILGFEVGGLISHDFFRTTRLSFDFDRMQLLIQAP